MNGRIKVSFCKNGFEQYYSDNRKFGTAELVNKHGKFYLHIPVTYEITELNKSEVSNVVGIDCGIRFLAVRYDSNRKSVSTYLNSFLYIKTAYPDQRQAAVCVHGVLYEHYGFIGYPK